MTPEILLGIGLIFAAIPVSYLVFWAWKEWWKEGEPLAILSICFILGVTLIFIATAWHDGQKRNPTISEKSTNVLE